MSDWFSSFASQVSQLADQLTDTIVLQANSAQEEFEQERAKLKAEEEQRMSKLRTDVSLPWETNDAKLSILSQDVMEKILALSLNEENFTVPPKNVDVVYFNFQDFVATAMKLLELDSNLSKMHSRVSPKMNEEDFWKFYYCRIYYLRCVAGFEGTLEQQKASKWTNDEIIFSAIHHVEEKPTRLADPLIISSASSSSAHFTATEREKSDKSPVTRSHLSGSESSSAMKESAESSGVVASGNGDLDEDNVDLDDLELLQELEAGQEDYEEIEVSDIDEELEAQIKRELQENDD